jgi:hypothetical protein
LDERVTQDVAPKLELVNDNSTTTQVPLKRPNRLAYGEPEVVYPPNVRHSHKPHTAVPDFLGLNALSRSIIHNIQTFLSGNNPFLSSLSGNDAAAVNDD